MSTIMLLCYNNYNIKLPQIIQENKDKVETTKTVSEVENRTEDDEGWTVVSRKRWDIINTFFFIMIVPDS